MSFPQRHHLCGPGADTTYDYTLGLEMAGAQASITGPALAKTRCDTRHGEYRFRRDGARRRRQGWRRWQRRQRRCGFSTCQRGRCRGKPSAHHRRGQAPDNCGPRRRAFKRGSQNMQLRTTRLRCGLRSPRQWISKRAGWNGSPISTARLYSELWPLIMNEDWCLASPSNFSGSHHVQLWDHNKPYSYLGGQGAGGMGYGAPASVGAALAAKARNRIVVNVQTDGDLNYSPGVPGGRLCTCAADANGSCTTISAWHQEYMFVEYMAGDPRTGRRSCPHRQHASRSLPRLRKDGGWLRHGWRRSHQVIQRSYRQR